MEYDEELGVETETPAVALDETEAAEAVEDLTQQSEPGVSSEAVPAAVDEVGADGVSMKNRAEQFRRMYEKEQRDNQRLFKAVEDLTAVQKAALPERVDPDLEALEEMGVPPEVLKRLDARYGGMLEGFKQKELVPAESTLVDRANEEIMARLLQTEEYAAAKPYLDEARDLLHQTAPQLRADPRAPYAALTNAMANHLPEIRAAEREAGRKEAAKNRKILGETNSSSSFRLPSGEIMDVSEDTKRALEYLAKKGTKVDLANLAKNKKKYEERKEHEHTLPRKRR